MELLQRSTVFSLMFDRIKSEKRKYLLHFIILDVAIGVILQQNFVNIELLHDNFWNFADLLATYLDMLISWLQNNPIGLKLNTPVNSTLSSFFRYHVFLWTTFINFLRDRNFTMMLSYSLWFGVSTLSAVLADLTKVLFIHFICFDAYATRLWSICFYTLQELWSLVRGKKWNPLRNRRDSIVLDFRQQFLCTSLFVILIFIIPTIYVFFIVFRILRCCVSAIIYSLTMLSNWPTIAVSIINKCAEIFL